jgi:hypothetical protein
MWPSSLLIATNIPQHAARATIFKDKIHMSFLFTHVFIRRTWGGVYGEIFPFTDATSDARSLHYRRWMPALQAKVARS